MKLKRYTEEEDKVILSNPSNKEVAEKLKRNPNSISVRRSALKKEGRKLKRKYTKRVDTKLERLSATGAMMNFKVNGTELSIEKGVKQVIVGKNSIEINL